MTKTKITYGPQSDSTSLNVESLLYDSVIGVVWEQGNTTPTVTRVDGAGNNIEIDRSVFDSHVVWSNIRRCNLSDAGVVNAYYGDAAFEYDGSNGQVMVEIPKFYYKSKKVGTKHYRWISPHKLFGFKVHPAFVSDSVEHDQIYISAFEGLVEDVTAGAIEVNKIQITAEPTSSGNLTITLDGNYAFTVAILDADTIEGVVDKIVASGNKTDYQGTVWTVVKIDADELTYTADGVGLHTTVTMPNACGVTSTITKTTPGTGGYVKNDAGTIDVTAGTGDKLCSIAGYKPCTGKNMNQAGTITMAQFRTLAQNRGVGWNLLNFNQLCAIQLLYTIEYANLDSQIQIGAGVTAITDASAGSSYNNAINTGFTAGIGTNGSDLGNASGECASVIHYKTLEAAKPMSYRGIENVYGNLYKWVDGINIKADRNPWVADHDFVVDTFAHPYVDTGLTNVSSNGYVSNIGFNVGLDYGFLASSISGGGSAYYLCDYYYQTTGNLIVYQGGPWSATATTYPGIFFLDIRPVSSTVARNAGARVCFVA